MSFGGRTYRAFRPSRFGRRDDDMEEDGQEARQAMLSVYAQRAQAGLPLFEQVDVVTHFGAGRNLAAM